MFCFAFSCAPILSKAGCSEAAANTVTEVAAGRPVLVGVPHAAISKSATVPTVRLITRQLHPDVGRLDDSDRRHAWLEVKLINRLPGQQRDEAVWPGLDLDLGRDAVLDHAGDDAGEAVARGLLGARLRRPLRFRDDGERFAVDEALPA